MTEEAMKLVRSAIEAADRRDVAAIEAIWSEDCEFHSTFAASEGRVFRGRQGVRDYFATLDDAFDHIRLEVKEIIEIDASRVFLRVRVAGRGKGSGVPIEHRYGQVWTVRRNEVRRVESYLDPADAQKAAGLRD